MEWVLRRDRYVSTHASHYVREMRIAAYSQMLESYSTLRLDTMSAAFGVSPEFLEKYAVQHTVLCSRYPRGEALDTDEDSF